MYLWVAHVLSVLPPFPSFASTSAFSAASAAGCKANVSWHRRALDSMNWIFVLLRIGQRLLFQFYEYRGSLKWFEERNNCHCKHYCLRVLHSHVLCTFPSFASTSAFSAASAGGCFKATVSWHRRASDSMNWVLVLLQIGQKLLFQFYEYIVPSKWFEERINCHCKHYCLRVFAFTCSMYISLLRFHISFFSSICCWLQNQCLLTPKSFR